MTYSFKQILSGSIISASLVLTGCGAASGNMGANSNNVGRMDTENNDSVVILPPKLPEASEPAVEPAPEVKPTIVAITDSNNDGHIAAWTVDSSLTDQSRWSALPIDNTAPWIQYDLSQIIWVDSVDVAFLLGNTRSTIIQIETSLDGNTWDSALLESSTVSDEAYETFTFTSRPAKYVRVVGYGNTDNAWTSILEVNIPGVAVAESVVIPPV
jgi:hypothetical protein